MNIVNIILLSIVVYMIIGICSFGVILTRFIMKYGEMSAKQLAILVLVWPIATKQISTIYSTMLSESCNEARAKYEESAKGLYDDIEKRL